MNGGQDAPKRVEFGVRTLAALTHWATAYEGGCGHELPQLARPDSLRSACWSCVMRDPFGWQLRGTCDACGAYIEQAGRWWVVDPDRTRGVVVHLRLCAPCTGQEVLDHPDDPAVCPRCTQRWYDAAVHSRPIVGAHDTCRAAMAAELAEQVADLHDRQSRIAYTRLRLALTRTAR